MGLPSTDYHAYIRSEAWQKKRRAFWRSKCRKHCYVCGKPPRAGFQLHHRTYKRLGNENISTDLVPVCPGCHREIHRIQKDERLSVWKATKRTRQKARKRQRKRAKHRWRRYAEIIKEPRLSVLMGEAID